MATAERPTYQGTEAFSQSANALADGLKQPVSSVPAIRVGPWTTRMIALHEAMEKAELKRTGKRIPPYTTTHPEL